MDYQTILAILTQITSYGAIDPSWVLSGITVAAAYLLWNQVKDIKEALKSISKSLKEISDLVNLHDKDIARLKDKTGLK